MAWGSGNNASLSLMAKQAVARKAGEAAPIPGAAPLAPGPVAMGGLTPPTPPIVAPGINEALARTAADKQRRRAKTGSLLTRPTAPISAVPAVGSRTAPRALIGY